MNVSKNINHSREAGWLGDVPVNWPIFSSRRLFEQRKERARPDDVQLTASQKHGIIPQEMFMEIERQNVVQVVTGSEILKHVEPNDFVISMRSFQGGLEYSTHRGSISSAYVMLIPKLSLGIWVPYFRHLFKSDRYIQALQSTSNLVRDGQAMRYGNFAKVPLPLPPMQEQQTIAAFLDRETGRFDDLVAKKRRLVELASHRIEAVASQAISDPMVPRVRLDFVMNRVARPAVLSEHNELVRLGLLNRGRGIFKKPAADEEEMGDSTFFFVEPGDLIISGQFAWEGAVAIAGEDEEGCVVSHRYPVFLAKDGISTAYLLGLLRSKFGDLMLNESSRGSAGRNRPLNTWRLGKEKVPVPSVGVQEQVARAIRYENLLKKRTDRSITLINELRSALISAAVTGQIDVTTWGKQGQTDRRLDKIQEEMGA